MKQSNKSSAYDAGELLIKTKGWSMQLLVISDLATLKKKMCLKRPTRQLEKRKTAAQRRSHHSA